MGITPGPRAGFTGRRCAWLTKSLSSALGSIVVIIE